MKKTASLFVAVVLGALALPAGAATLPTSASFVLSQTSGSVPAGNIDLQSITPNGGVSTYFDTYTLSQGTLALSWAEIVTGNDRLAPWTHKKPEGIGGNENYLAVYGLNVFPGKATFTFTTPVKNLSFVWGTVDDYNWIKVTNTKNETYMITGADLMANVGWTNGDSNHVTGKYFSLTDLAGIVSAAFLSCKDAFEVARLNVTPVPLPAALPLFAMGLAGLVGTRRMKKDAKV